MLNPLLSWSTPRVSTCKSSSPIAAGVAAIALLFLTSACSSARKSVSQAEVNAPGATSGASASTNSNSAKAALVEYLNKKGVKLYGTYWCPYCNRQKELFSPAIATLQYVECDPKGENAQPDACARANVSSYPTWEIDGQLYRGLRSLEEIAAISGYQGSQTFDN